MKPELKAMMAVTGVRMTHMPLRMLCETFLASLHWRGYELWMGPVYFGRVFLCGRDGEPLFAWGRYDHPVKYKEAEPQARDALWAAARAQIEQWFKEQAE